MSEQKNQETESCDYKQAASLRDEVIQSQKARSEFFKYKLISIATLSSIGLGFNSYQTDHVSIEPVYVLCVIPFVCIYVDLLCWHNTLRILVIGRFLDYMNDSYEKYLSIIDNNIKKKKISEDGASYLFELEDYALQWSNYAISIMLFCYGIYFLTKSHLSGKGVLFVVVGMLGIILTMLIERKFKRRKDTLFAEAEELIKQLAWNKQDA